MVEQSEDYRFNPALQQSCQQDIRKFCINVVAKEPANEELEGKVVKCLKVKFREQRLSATCERQLSDIMREAALNYKLNPVLAAACHAEVNYLSLP
jgi:golgi apparatus protein 1